MAAAALAVSLAGLCTAQATNPILAPDLDPAELLRAAAEKNYFGVVEVVESKLEVSVAPVGEHAPVATGFLLSRPGEPLLLRADWQLGNAAASDPARSGRLENRELYRQTLHVETQWEGESDDRLLPTNGGQMEWISGSRDGRASWVTASVAELRLERGARELADPSIPVPAVLSSGKGGVLILPGVAFDRAGDGLLFGQNIGIYPSETGSGAPSLVRERAALYRPPEEFYRLDERSAVADVTATKKLAAFFPPTFDDEEIPAVRYVALSPRLLTFWQAFEAAMSEQHGDAAKLTILRGFLSPTDRMRLERRGVRLAEFTRYQYGDAVAVVLGESPGSDRQRDLNDDGKADAADIDVLAELAKRVMDELGIYGGVGVCAAYEGPGPAAGTPYLHVDLRGWYVPFREE